MVLIESTMAVVLCCWKMCGGNHGEWIKWVVLGNRNFMYLEGDICTTAYIKKISLNCELNSSIFFIDISYFNMWEF